MTSCAAPAGETQAFVTETFGRASKIKRRVERNPV
jgi:hypothetical protein